MSDLQAIQNLLKEASELMGQEGKGPKKEAARKMRSIQAIAETIALTLEIAK